MQFEQSQTYTNLAKAFAGESQARNRYTIYAKEARKEGQEFLARLFEETADNEKVHGEEFFEMLSKHGTQPIENIDINAGYPFVLGNLEQNLDAAARGEWEEHSEAYPAFAEMAEREGYPDVARLFRQIASFEAIHHMAFVDALEQVKNGTLYQKDQKTAWRCLNCGFTFYGEKPLDSCPVCQKGRGWTEGEVARKNIADHPA